MPVRAPEPFQPPSAMQIMSPPFLLFTPPLMFNVAMVPGAEQRKRRPLGTFTVPPFKLKVETELAASPRVSHEFTLSVELLLTVMEPKPPARLPTALSLTLKIVLVSVAVAV